MNKKFAVQSDGFYVDGVKTKIMSGAIHYFRVVPQYWHDRLLKLKELGCNCVETYICWNLHEKEEGVFDFSRWLDFPAFLTEAQKLGLYAIVRPGPYICSEWDFGGLPWWLLKYPDLQLRCSDAQYLQKCAPYLTRVCDLLRPHLIGNGGNVILVQIENEYGSYGSDKEYLRWLKDVYVQNDITCPLITSDGESEFLLHNGTLPDVIAAVNYRKDSERCLAQLQKYHGGQPGAVLELWNGKAQHWGEEIERRDVAEVAESVRTALQHAELVNLYMFHGGTTFGLMNGSLDTGEKHILQLNSYDVDAPVDEYGRRTPKYYAEQQVICKALGKPVSNTATDPKLQAYGEATYVGQTDMEHDPHLLKKQAWQTVPAMEQCDLGYGWIVYCFAPFIGAKGADIILPEVHDIAHVYVNGVYAKTVYRHSKEKSVHIDASGIVNVSILAENMGRVNYGVNLRDRKGLVGDIRLYDYEYSVYTVPHGFTVYTLSPEALPQSYGKEVCAPNAPAFYKFTFTTGAGKPQDTVLRLTGFTRGAAYINGFCLGRHYTVEHSENKLFIPAPLLKKGVNELVVFDVLACPNRKSVRLCAQ